VSPILVIVLLAMNAALLAALIVVLMLVHHDSKRMAELAGKTQQLVHEMEEHARRDFEADKADNEG